MTPRLRLLGPFAVLGTDGAGSSVDVGGRRAKALLARLALDPGRVVAVDALVDAVWDGAPPAAPANALQAVVSRVRRAVPDLPLLARAPGYLLDLPRTAVDAGAFEALVARAREAGDPQAVVDLLAEAEALWTGDALADLRELAFTTAPAVRWAELRLGAAEQRLAAVLATGDAGAALAELDVLAEEHPLRETTARLRVRALHRLGRPAEALAAYEQVRARLADELGLDPSPALQAEQLAVLRDDVPAGRLRPTLRAPLTSFRGRGPELDAVAAALDAGRLVTLLGAGGAGKTRLALEAARLRDPQVPDGVWWVELAPVADPRLLPGVVLTAVGRRESTSLERVPTFVEAADRLREVFADGEALLVLDNCEHLVGAVAGLTDDLLTACPGLRVLTTSREPLGVPGETLLPVGPLTVPADDDPGAADTAVVRLFADRAAAARPGFEVTPATLRLVLDVCRRLDGMPLALELAAARLRTLGIAQIAARLDDRFSLLTGGSRIALPRHQTLRAVVEWSWDALSPAEQAVGRRLSVFSGGATLEAAEAVCGGAGVPAVLDAVGGLVEKSLLLAVPDTAGSVRYRMLETVRAYGAEQLSAAGERDRVEAAHTTWSIELLDRLDPLLRRADQLAALAELHAEHDGLVAVLQREVAAGAVDTAVHLAGRLCWYWLLSGRQVAAGRWLADVLALPAEPGALRAACTAFSALARAETGDWTEGRVVLRGVRDLPPALTWDSGEPMAAFGWALAVAFTGSSDELAPVLAHADPWVAAGVRAVAVQVAENTGVLGPTATADLEAAHAAFAELGDRWGRSLTAGALAALRGQDGDLDGAVALTTEALGLSEELGMQADTPLLRIRLAGLYVAQGDTVSATRELDVVESSAAGDGGPVPAFAVAGRSSVALAENRPADARELARHAVALLAEVRGGPDQVDGLVRSTLGVVLALGAAASSDPAADLAEARTVLERALSSAGTSGDMPVVAVVLHGWAVLAEAEGDPVEAARLVGVATAVRGRDDLGDPVVLALLTRLVAVLGEERVAGLRAAGAALSRAQALDELGVPASVWPAEGRADDRAAPSRSRRRPAPPTPG